MAQNFRFVESTTALGSTGVKTGDWREVPVEHCYFNAIASADQSGTLRIDGCDDTTGTVYRVSADIAVTATAPGSAHVPVLFRYYRAVYTNGATAQGSFACKTGFSAA